MDSQDLLAAADIRLVDEHLPVEPPGTKQRRVQYLGPVGGAHDDDALARVEPVHFGEQLVQRLLALLVAAQRALHARFAERVELVDEDDARRFRFGLGELIAHARGADADEHLHELRAAQAEERHLGLPGDRFRQQRFSCPWRTDEQHAFRNAPAEICVLPRLRLRPRRRRR